MANTPRPLRRRAAHESSCAPEQSSSSEEEESDEDESEEEEPEEEEPEEVVAPSPKRARFWAWANVDKLVKGARAVLPDYSLPE